MSPTKNCANSPVHKHSHELVEWMLSADLATATLLMLTVIALIVVVLHDKKKSFNRLTMLPYYFMLLFCVLTIVEYSIIGFYEDNYPDMLVFINLNSSNALFIAIAIQNYEWLNALGMIQIQKQLDVTNVPIERRRFRPLEQKVYYAVITFLTSYVLTTNGLLLIAFYKRK